MGHYASEMCEDFGIGPLDRNTRKQRFDKRRMWRTARGEVLRPKQFQDDHLLNTIRLLDRRYAEGDPSFFWQDPIFSGMEPPEKEDIWPIYGMLVREAHRRGLVLKPIYDPGSRKQNRQGRLVSRGPIVTPSGRKWDRQFDLGFDGITIVLKESDAEDLARTLNMYFGIV